MLSMLLQVQSAAATPAGVGDFSWLFLKMLIALGIVSVLAVLILKYAVPHIGVMKRFQRGKYFKVLGRFALEPKRSLYLVHVGEKYLVLGVADSAINLITELSAAEVKGEH